MRYLKFLKLQINFSSGQITIKNNDDKCLHWLFLTIPDFPLVLGNDLYYKIILQDPFGNDFGLFFIDYNQTSGTATYFQGQLFKDIKGMPLFIPYNWSILIISNATTSGSAILNCLAMAFDNLEELIDYAFGIRK